MGRVTAPLAPQLTPDRCVDLYIAAARDAVTRRIAAPDESTQAFEMDPRVLVPRVLLRAYRSVPSSLALEELLERELSNLLAEQSPEDLAGPPDAPTDLSLGDLKVGPVAGDVAKDIHQQRHYLASFRTDGEHLGLFSPASRRRPVALATMSPLDVASLIRMLPPGVDAAETLVLSRLFAEPHAPRNILSFMIGRLSAWARAERPDIKLLLTYLDPNLGFTGTIYRATNWFLFAREPKHAYQYLDGRYVTARELIHQFGTADFGELRARIGERVSRSTLPLHPLLIYGQWVRRVNP